MDQVVELTVKLIWDTVATVLLGGATLSLLARLLRLVERWKEEG